MRSGGRESGQREAELTPQTGGDELLPESSQFFDLVPGAFAADTFVARAASPRHVVSRQSLATSRQ